MGEAYYKRICVLGINDVNKGEVKGNLCGGPWSNKCGPEKARCLCGDKL